MLVLHFFYWRFEAFFGSYEPKSFKLLTYISFLIIYSWILIFKSYRVLFLEEDGEEISNLPTEENQALAYKKNIDENIFENVSEGLDTEKILPRDVCGRLEVAEKFSSENDRPTVLHSCD